MKEGKFSFSNKKQTSVMAAAAVLGLLIFSLLVWMVRADRQETRRTILDISDIFLAEMADYPAAWKKHILHQIPPALPGNRTGSCLLHHHPRHG